ncbi:MAG: Fic family protein [Candidatus Cloacimonadota bacterium]|nr:Fic family protein [Candidatus Cloacimonadota bacterium]
METLDLLQPKVDLETKQILKKLTSVHRFLAEFKGAVKTVPNEEILLNTLALQEAKDSSEIENIITTHDDLYKEDLHIQYIKNSAAKEVQNYREALKIGFDLVSKSEMMTLTHILKIQEKIERNNAGFRKLPGTQLKNTKTGKVIYTPPQNPLVINKLLNNLETYINSIDDIDPIVKMAVIHFQFESIHPFYDGNGRTGRIINILYLVLNQLLNLPVLYFSRFIINNKSDYYRLLQEVRTDNNWEEWIMYNLDAVETTAKQGVKTIKQINDLMLEYEQLIKKKQPKIYSKELLENLFKHPYTKIEFVMSDLNITKPTAIKYLKAIEDIGLLKKKKMWKTNYYINNDLYNLFLNQGEK